MHTSTCPGKNGTNILSNVKAAPSLSSLGNNDMNNNLLDSNLGTMDPHPTKYFKSKPSLAINAQTSDLVGQSETSSKIKHVYPQRNVAQGQLLNSLEKLLNAYIWKMKQRMDMVRD
ncbi:hypothetical protein Fot_35134 [Forsythia ovata]|uniref:Uncharacterized protein n=1 Tax=Forsythia ovata TaxID=205694 RepID=A0ABD1SLC1_9LAMI